METSNKHEDSTTYPRPSIVHQDTMSSTEEKLKPIVMVVNEKGSDSRSNIDDASLEGDSKPVYRNGEPVITTGRDVSRFVVDIRDDEDPALTFRSLFLGTVFAGMGAALCQVSHIFLVEGSTCRHKILTIAGTDILVQASANGSFYRLPAALDLYYRQCLG